MPRYEYHLLEFADEDELEDIEKKFNELGAAFWELLSFDGTTAVFKRRRQGLD